MGEGAPRPDLLTPLDLPVAWGRYRLLELVGEGGMARVFRAELRGPSGFRKQLALKVIRSSVTAGHEGLRRALMNEARLGGLLHHQSVVETYDFGEVDSQPFIAMELVRGRTLAQLTREGERLPLAVVVELARQAALGLEHAHGIQVDGRQVLSAHRDLKPSNLMLNRDGVLKVMDFGIAKAATNAGASTATGLTKGTPTYMSPEQAEGEAVDARSDLFSLAAIAFELACGERLFGGDSLMAVMMAVLQVEKRIAKDARFAALEAAAPQLAAVLRRCLRYSPSDRYPSMTELLGDLEELKLVHPLRGSFRSWSRRAIGPERKVPGPPPPPPSMTAELAASSEVSLEAVTPPPAPVRSGSAPSPPPQGRLRSEPTPSRPAASASGAPGGMAETLPGPRSGTRPPDSPPPPVLPPAASPEEIEDSRGPSPPPTSQDTLAATRLVPNRRARRRRLGLAAAAATSGVILLVLALSIVRRGPGPEEELAGLDGATTGKDTAQPPLPELGGPPPEAPPTQPAAGPAPGSGDDVGPIVGSPEVQRARDGQLTRDGGSISRKDRPAPNGPTDRGTAPDEPGPRGTDAPKAPVTEGPGGPTNGGEGSARKGTPGKRPRDKPVDRAGEAGSSATEARAQWIEKARRNLDRAGILDPGVRVRNINDTLRSFGYDLLSPAEEWVSGRFVEPGTTTGAGSKTHGSRRGTTRESSTTIPPIPRGEFIVQTLASVPGGGTGNAEIRLHIVKSKLKTAGYRALNSEEEGEVLKYRP